MLELNYIILSVLFTIVQTATIVYFIRKLNKKDRDKDAIKRHYIERLTEDRILYRLNKFEYAVRKHFESMGMKVIFGIHHNYELCYEDSDKLKQYVSETVTIVNSIHGSINVQKDNGRSRIIDIIENKELTTRLEKIILDFINKEEYVSTDSLTGVLAELEDTYNSCNPCSLRHNLILYIDDEREYKKALLKGLI